MTKRAEELIEGKPEDLPTSFKVTAPWITDARKPPLHAVGLADLGTPAGQDPKKYAAELMMIGAIEPEGGKAEKAAPADERTPAEKAAETRSAHEAAEVRMREVMAAREQAALTALPEVKPLTEEEQAAVEKARKAEAAEAEKIAKAATEEAATTTKTNAPATNRDADGGEGKTS
jgi:hypothetical protein